ncbi:rhamnogalacturonan lyase family protein [Micromonospora phytophila]|uniref:rhamnogalacturonan lyase family protein n=1 Tax=Micromonospora phytophila TaxID=709888 RepID=UPI003FD85733
MVWPTADSRALRIHSTPTPTTTRIHTLMHDPQYRVAVAWQNTADNQPPHPGFFIGAGMATPPTPRVYLR